MPESYPYAVAGPTPTATEAVFGARNPQLLVRSADHLVCFRDGEYRTVEPALIDFLCRVVADEARGNRGVWVKQLPAVAPDEAPRPAQPAVVAGTAAGRPPPTRKAKRS